MENPFKLGSFEYTVTASFIEFFDELEYYLTQSEGLGVRMDAETILKLMKFGEENHKEIIDEKRPMSAGIK